MITPDGVNKLERGYVIRRKVKPENSPTFKVSY
jgi:hypothetical protein